MESQEGPQRTKPINTDRRYKPVEINALHYKHGRASIEAAVRIKLLNMLAQTDARSLPNPVHQLRPANFQCMQRHC